MKEKRKDRVPSQYEARVMDETIEVEPGTWNAYRIAIDLEKMPACHIIGSLNTSGGSGNDIEFLAFDEKNYQEWEKRMDGEHRGEPREVLALYRSGRAALATFDMPVLSSDTYFFVFNNHFSNFSRKLVTVKIFLKYSD